MFLIDTIKPKVEINKKLVLIFVRLFKGGELKSYKIKPVLFLFTLGLLAATKKIFKRNNKVFCFGVHRSLMMNNILPTFAF